MVVKLDLACAFDRVRHDFLFAAMSNFGFNQRFINWVKACISNPWIAPLINGRPTSFFRASRGLRQGCPLSPVLFVLQAAVLSFQLNRKLQNRSLSGIKIVPKVKEANHAQFADDTLLLGAADLNTAGKFKAELDFYKISSGSEINYQKSKVFGWNCTPQEMLEISRMLEMEGLTAWDTFTYLGIPIFKASPRVSHWLPLLDRLKNKIQAWGAKWLNRAGKVILMNSVLASLPIFQCSVLLAPKTITNKISELLRRFLWEGGRNNDKKLHLVSWDKVLKPKMEGGLQIRDVSTQNLAMGGKILWNMISGKKTWSKQILKKKYFKGDRERCLEKDTKVQKGSPIFLLCKKAIPYFTPMLTWIPGNGAKIQIWNDSILGEQPLHEVHELDNIKAWLNDNNRTTLWDISTWGSDENAAWESWNLGDYPIVLQEEAMDLLDHLQGKTPISARARDKRGWGSRTGKFSAAEGYMAIQAIPWASPNPAPWKSLWHYQSIPKIDHFIWTALHNAILTTDNLRRKGWEMPSRCPLCTSAEETVDHLFLFCDFTKDVWNAVLWPYAVSLPGTFMELISEWAALSPFCLNNKISLKIIWMWIPKFLCWKIWLERNNRVFKETSRLPLQVAVQAKILLSEALNCKPGISNKATLSAEEERWAKEFHLNPQSKDISNPPQRANWEIRIEEQEFIKWRSALGEWCLFFDGASKGNPGQAGGGGIIFDPDGNLHLSFAWGLGLASNNQAEYLALWQGLNQARKLNIQKLFIFGDSRLIIKALRSKKMPSDINLVQIHRKILLLLSHFSSSKAHHVLRNLNSLADAEANRGTLLNKSQLIINGDLSNVRIP